MHLWPLPPLPAGKARFQDTSSVRQTGYHDHDETPSLLPGQGSLLVAPLTLVTQEAEHYLTPCVPVHSLRWFWMGVIEHPRSERFHAHDFRHKFLVSEIPLGLRLIRCFFVWRMSVVLYAALLSSCCQTRCFWEVVTLVQLCF